YLYRIFYRYHALRIWLESPLPYLRAIAIKVEQLLDIYPVDNLQYPLFLNPKYYSLVKLDGWGFHLPG
ncbi:hypothetical protein, partial [Limnospira platensis]|uniref:hypothetical protein n=1 Tax=Limnospira platensis TaxID=118562 RepID=UPI00256FEB9F